MKRQDYLKQLQNKTVSELEQGLEDTRRELAETKIQHSMNRLKDHSQMKKLRRQLARIQTIINQKREEQPNVS